MGRARTAAVPAPARARGGVRQPGTRGVAVVAVGLAVALLATGCAAAAPGPQASPGVAVASPDCLAPQVLGRLGLTLDPALAAQATPRPDVTAGAVPAGFVPAGVLACQVGGQMRDSAGTWTAVTATSREGSTADVAALVTALDAAAAGRTGPAAPTPAASCGAAGAPVVLWLLDAMGSAVLSAAAVDGCDDGSARVRAALDRMPVTGVVDQPVQLVAAAG